jgi:hypothetical protein
MNSNSFVSSNGKKHTCERRYTSSLHPSTHDFQSESYALESCRAEEASCFHCVPHHLYTQALARENLLPATILGNATVKYNPHIRADTKPAEVREDRMCHPQNCPQPSPQDKAPGQEMNHTSSNFLWNVYYSLKYKLQRLVLQIIFRITQYHNYCVTALVNDV